MTVLHAEARYLRGMFAFGHSVLRDNLDENGGSNQSLKRRPVAKV